MVSAVNTPGSGGGQSRPKRCAENTYRWAVERIPLAPTVGSDLGNRLAAPASNNHCLAPEPGQPISVGTLDRRPDCVAAGLLVRFRSWQPPNPPESALRLPVHTFREPVGWLVPMLESNTCSCRSPRSGDARSRDAADRTLRKGCAVATTSNRDAGDRCNLYPSEFEVTPRAALGAAGTLPSTEDSARRTPTRERRASRYVPFGPSRPAGSLPI